MDFVRDYPDDRTCLDYLWRRLYSADGSTAECPKCEKVRRFHRVASRPSYSCDTCGHHIHPTAGTIFHKSSTALHLWFHAVFLMAQTRCGISAKQLERELGVTYKTAWRMFNKIRSMLTDDASFGGTVELDEAYIGGSEKWMHRSDPRRVQGGTGGRGAGKTPVFGMAQRKTESSQGKVIAKVVPDVSGRSLLPHVATRVLPASTVYTDEWAPYDKLDRMGYAHSRVHHKQEVYVDGDVHVNTIEGFWALLKGGLRGVYHGVSTQHLQSYLDEFTFRYNHREAPGGMFHAFLGQIVQPI
jgi:transposase